ncbi:helix-turn-helix domain-containing protein [Natronolimnohabitans sp. A-GB9]|uniref:TrmB family transcriptional regulator n=1 Tax=Natronolimnohabitans sp. A-GB9 TaxID=3069757 RepID=UPI0027B64D1E|nr:helix-turn-helix domain-containing protein [Natronolimnohabitans sp. A-GB9]MDQ2050827.1 helix-turn-helix domain-containing protein [Natronolimnohabitans sp. A-GB9]
MSTAEEAVTSLETLGMTEYEARCFVALTRISAGTAKEISQVADVPRSRVYDTIERLERKGLVNVQQSEPREYMAVSVETACRRLREDYDSRLSAAENALEQVEEPESAVEEGMWAISQSEHVTDRIVAFLEEATDTVHYLVPAIDVFEGQIAEALSSAAGRGVEVYIEVPTDDARDDVLEMTPDVEVVVASDLRQTSEVYSERPGQLLMVDGEAIVAAGVAESDLPGVVDQMAVWTHGRDHGFAVWMRELLDDRLEKDSRE